MNKLFDIESKPINGVVIKEGDLVEYYYGPGYGFTKIVDIDGALCLEYNFLFGNGIRLDVFLGEYPGMISNRNNSVRKISIKDMYLICKERKWSFKYYIDKYPHWFKKK